MERDLELISLEVSSNEVNTFIIRVSLALLEEAVYVSDSICFKM